MACPCSPSKAGEDRPDRWESATVIPPPQEVEAVDDQLEVLVDARRRFIITALHEEESPTTSLEELATRLAGWELDVPDETILENEFDRRKFELHHRHLPRLDDCGVIEFDQGNESIAETKRTEHYYDLIQHIHAYLLPA